MSTSSISTSSVEVFDDRLFFPESPRWHDGALWVSDIQHRTVFRYDPDGRRVPVAAFAADQSGIGFDAAGRLFAVSMPDCRLLTVAEDGIHQVADLTPLNPVLCNDLAVASDGTAYVTQLGFDMWGGGQFQLSRVIRVRPDGTAEEIGPPMASPNGIVLSPDERTLYVSESGGGKIQALSTAADPADAGKVFAELAPAAGSPLPVSTPDGICLDSAGGIWAADPTGHRVVRLDSAGALTDQIDFGDDQPLAVALGGEENRTLFICVVTDSNLHAPRVKPTGRIMTTAVQIPGL
ncbi:SMP-30/gluconolactonase/LRE family protein [Actinocorallia aurantiaca]|uniref:SMP-30/gluconolactonase/LRE family protein n=1 Tax=Actinocorallia aurantiaca TaxID=46204 RepID=A0ABN3UL47_9ACTN